MSAEQTVSDEELVAYLDGAIEETRRMEIEAALTGDGALRGRVRALDADMAGVRGAFDSLLAMAPPPPAALLSPVARRPRLLDGGVSDRPRFAPDAQDVRGARPKPRMLRVGRPAGRGWMRAAAVLLLGVGLGYGAGAFAPRGGDAEGWRVAVAQYQSLYTGATLAFAPSDAASQADEVRAVSLQLGRPITPDAIQAPGFTFRRAQALAYHGRPLVQFAYVSAGGVPVALCATRVGGPDQPLREGTVRGLPEVTWSRDGFGFMVVGDMPAAELRRLADAVFPRV